LQDAADRRAFVHFLGEFAEHALARVLAADPGPVVGLGAFAAVDEPSSSMTASI
jgi:hypothetical protein